MEKTQHHVSTLSQRRWRFQSFCQSFNVGFHKIIITSSLLCSDPSPRQTRINKQTTFVKVTNAVSQNKNQYQTHFFKIIQHRISHRNHQSSRSLLQDHPTSSRSLSVVYHSKNQSLSSLRRNFPTSTLSQQSSINNFTSSTMREPRSPHRYGKEHWAFDELKSILSIEYLNLRCQATVDCTTTFTIFYTPTVRSLLKKLSNISSDLHRFSSVLRELASVLSCKPEHRGWEDRICQRWAKILYEAGEEEGRYLQERKIIQAEVKSRSLKVETAKLRVETVAMSSDPGLKDPNSPRPVVHCIRHGEVFIDFYYFISLHLRSISTRCVKFILTIHQAGNGREENYFIHDPELTSQGIKDCHAFSKAFDRHDHITHLIVSPLSRTVSSALAMFAPAIADGIKLTLVPEIQAASSCFSCIGLPRDQLKEKYRMWKNSINFDFVGSTWTVKLDGPYSSHYDCVHKRVKEIIQWCRDGKDSDDGVDGRREIVLVTHQSILGHLGRKFGTTSLS